MRDIYYHLGLHKTGTTFLQNKYFAKLPITYYKGGQSFIKVIESFSNTNDKILISDENFSGQLFSGKKREQLFKMVHSIKAIHPNAKVIIGFRKHSDFVLSAYKQALHQGDTLSFKSFYNIQNDGILKNRDLNFQETIELLKSIFSDVFIYTISDVRDLELFNKEFSKFIDIEPLSMQNKQKEVNKSIQSVLQVNVLLKLNKFDKKFSKIFKMKLLYSKLFKLLKITPRKVCQNYLPSSGEKYRLDNEILNYLDDTFQKDWSFVMENKNIKPLKH